MRERENQGPISVTIRINRHVMEGVIMGKMRRVWILMLAGLLTIPQTAVAYAENEELTDDFLADSFEEILITGEEGSETGALETEALETEVPEIEECITGVEEELVSVGASLGNCGKDLDWSLRDGILMITGSGPMYDFLNDTEWGDAPWWDDHESIVQVIIGDGVTRIGNEAFLGCTKLTSVTIPDSVTEIGKNAFAWCNSLAEIALSERTTSIGERAFVNCTGLKKVRFYGNAPSIASNAFENVISNVYYWTARSGWTSEKTVNYGGTLTWIGTKTPKPARIIGLYNSQNGGDLRWEAMPGAEQYEIHRTNAGKTEVIATVDATQTTYMDTSIKDNCWGKVYVYYVRCRAGADLSPRGEGKTLQRLAPMKITSIKNNAKGQAAIVYTVSSGSNKAFGYEIQYAEKKADLYSQSGTFKKLSMNSRNSLTWTITGLKKGTMYYFRIRAYVNYTHSVTKVITRTWSQYSGVESVKITQ